MHTIFIDAMNILPCDNSNGIVFTMLCLILEILYLANIVKGGLCIAMFVN